MTKHSPSPLRVALLAGGDSSEREISLASGREVTAALESRGHAVDSFDPAATPLRDIYWGRYDVCFIALHGGAGEDGRIQAELEDLVVPYTGSGPKAARRAMSKSAAKRRFERHRVPSPPAIAFETTDAFHEVACRAAPLGYPLVIKPDSQGSSLGVGLAADESELAAKAIDASRYDSLLLAERWIDGREFTVAVLGRRALPLLEICTPGRWFDYEAKYVSDAAEHRFETEFPEAKIDELQSLAVAAAASLETAGLCRVDLLVDQAGQPWVLEANTVPGLTSHSLAPKAAARAGLDFASLCEWMLADGLRRFSLSAKQAEISK